MAPRSKPGVQRSAAPGRAGARAALPEELRLRGRKVLRGLKTLYPGAICALEHRNALELLVATMLSAQSTDKLVNQVTPALFARYPDARAFAEADLAELEQTIHSTGFFRQKARNIQRACRRLVEAHDGEVPDTVEDLLELPGVARKTANVVLGTWFGKNEGVVVDTHVGRLAHRLGLTWSSRDTKDAVKIEADLMQILPRREWTFFSHATILHGRAVCGAKNPRCGECGLAKVCPSAFSFAPKPAPEPDAQPVRTRPARKAKARTRPRPKTQPAPNPRRRAQG
jgi:endonuclease-3